MTAGDVLLITADIEELGEPKIEVGVEDVLEVMVQLVESFDIDIDRLGLTRGRLVDVALRVRDEPEPQL